MKWHWLIIAGFGSPPPCARPLLFVHVLPGLPDDAVPASPALRHSWKSQRTLPWNDYCLLLVASLCCVSVSWITVLLKEHEHGKGHGKGVLKWVPHTWSANRKRERRANTGNRCNLQFSQHVAKWLHATTMLRAETMTNDLTWTAEQKRSQLGNWGKMFIVEILNLSSKAIVWRMAGAGRRTGIDIAWYTMREAERTLQGRLRKTPWDHPDQLWKSELTHKLNDSNCCGKQLNANVEDSGNHTQEMWKQVQEIVDNNGIDCGKLSCQVWKMW